MKTKKHMLKDMLKVEFHTHTKNKEDPHIKYSWKELVDHYAKMHYDVMAITNHNELTYSKEMASYAKKKGILLIPSVEATIEGMHVLVINVKPNEKLPRTFEDLKRFKRESSLVIAAHPFFVLHSLGKKLAEHITLFDGIEYCHFYTKFLNLNKKAERIAHRYRLPLIGTSDAHHLFQVGHTYAMVDSKKDASSIIKAIKQNRCRLVTKSLSLRDFIRTWHYVISSQ